MQSLKTMVACRIKKYVLYRTGYPTFFLYGPISANRYDNVYVPWSGLLQFNYFLSHNILLRCSQNSRHSNTTRMNHNYLLLPTVHKSNSIDSLLCTVVCFYGARGSKNISVVGVDLSSAIIEHYNQTKTANVIDIF